MTSRSLDSDDAPAAAPTALVIEPAVPNLLAVLGAISSTGFDVTVAESYHDAKTALTTHPPTLLIAGVKLREYNGLHLVLRATSIRPRVAAIVTTDTSDPVLQAEAEKMGATFVVMPTTQEELVAAICRTVLRMSPPNEHGEPIRPPFERRRTPDRQGCSIEDESGISQSTERRKDIAEAIRALAK